MRAQPTDCAAGRARYSDAMTARHLIPLLLLAGCDPRPAPTPAAHDEATKAIAGERAVDAGIIDNARISALQKQVNDLSAEVSELRDGKQAIDTQLLEQRLAAVEQRVYARAPTETPTPQPTPAARPTPRAPLKLALPPAEK